MHQNGPVSRSIRRSSKCYIKDHALLGVLLLQLFGYALRTCPFAAQITSGSAFHYGATHMLSAATVSTSTMDAAHAHRIPPYDFATLNWKA